MAKKSILGRKTKLTKDVVRKLEEAFSIDATISEACFYADISRDTYYNWIKHNKVLSDRFEALRNKPVLTARKTVNDSIKVDPSMAMKYLERKRKKEFSIRIETDNRNREAIDETSDKINNLLQELRKEQNADNGVQNRKGGDVQAGDSGDVRKEKEGTDRIS